MTLPRLSTLISPSGGPDEKAAEKYLCKLVNNKTVWAKIDRVSEIVVFKRKPSTEMVLNDWKISIEKVLQKLVHVSHLISKEKAAEEIKAAPLSGI